MNMRFIALALAAAATAGAQQVGPPKKPVDTLRVGKGQGAGGGKTIVGDKELRKGQAQGVGKGLGAGEWKDLGHDFEDLSFHLKDLSGQFDQLSFHLDEFKMPELDLNWDLQGIQGGIGKMHLQEMQHGLQNPQWHDFQDLQESQLALTQKAGKHADLFATDWGDRTAKFFATTPGEFAGFGAGMHELPARMPQAWAQGDAADSLYRFARETLNRGDWRRAAQSLQNIPQRYPNSAYAGEALYWQAFALYRIGTNNDLQEALGALATLRNKYPNRASQADAQSLGTRILGTLASRGDTKAAAELKDRATDNAQSCDREDQAVRAEALNALSRTEPENMSALMKTILARKDECSVQLRKSAVFLVGNKRDAEASAVLIGVAKNDPNTEVRVAAIDWLARMPGDEALTTLGDLARATSEDDAIQRAAVRALVNHPSDKARAQVRSIVERTDMPERLRSEALSAFSADRMSVEDMTWLRSVYAKLDNPRLKQRALSTIVRVGGTENDQWLMNIVKDDNEPSEIRATALRRIGQTMSIADIGKMYDGAASRSVRESLINILGNRKEPDATDKLIDIAKNGTDYTLRMRAVNALSNSKDPRAQKLLLELINK